MHPRAQPAGCPHFVIDRIALQCELVHGSSQAAKPAWPNVHTTAAAAAIVQAWTRRGVALWQALW